jgi:hypothetical protein
LAFLLILVPDAAKKQCLLCLILFKL